MANPQMTVKGLIAALSKHVAAHGDKPVTVWLPGSKVDLHQVMFEKDGEVLIEGNLREGSALS